MAKVTRKKIPRGVELTPDHAFEPIEDMKDEIVASGVDANQRKRKYSTFRLNFNVPWLDSKYFYDNRTPGSDEQSFDIDAPFYIPFCLPPLQDVFDGEDPRITKGVPIPVLTSVGLSFDQSDEPAAILSKWYGKTPLADGNPGDYFSSTAVHNGYQIALFTGTNGNPAVVGTTEYGAAAQTPRVFTTPPFMGMKNYLRTDAYDIELSILEKEQMFFSKGSVDARTSRALTKPTGELLSLSFPGTNYIAKSERRNPLTYEGVNKEINPYKTYMLCIKAPNLHDKDITRREHCAIVNLWVTLKFKIELTDRDAGDNIQNIPAHRGSKSAPDVTVTKPTAGNLITADDSGTQGVVSGVGLEAIDKQVRNKLRGGYGEFSMTHQAEAVKQDAAYEVLTVPLGQGFAFNRMSVRDDYPFAPYVRGPFYADLPAGAPGGLVLNPYVDRRIIPITHPMTIHHVVFAMNYTSDRLLMATEGPSNASAGRSAWRNMSEPTDTIKYEVGVGMISGVRGDAFNYAQVAYSTWVNNSSAELSDGQIDSVNLGLRAVDAFNEYKLWSVPLVLETGKNGAGYWSQYAAAGKGLNGKPYYVGESNTYTHARTTIGGVGGAAGTYAFSGGAVGDGNGTEQYLEVRLSVDPTNAGANIPYAFDSGEPAAERVEWQSTALRETDLAIGYGGCWLYIIGKKHVT